MFVVAKPQKYRHMGLVSARILAAELSALGPRSMRSIGSDKEHEA